MKQKFDLILLDLGYSSYQLEDEERGLSYLSNDQRLDMRFDQSDSNQVDAIELLNNSTELDLCEIFKRFGDEKYCEHLAKAVVNYRIGRVIQTTGELKQAIKEAFPNSNIDEKNNSIKRIFQAIRIATNQELLNLQQFLNRLTRE